MPVYDGNGNQITDFYNGSGVKIQQCYDRFGNQLVIGSDYFEQNGVKRNVTLTALGSVKYKQSFCRCDGKYYCTNGSYIAEYDSSFNLLRDVAASVGHGNAMQLGSNGIAYVSGWDDQKVYAVDLATLTVTDTITLPTTGYTTCAVDDVNKIIYIWQRDTRPNTESKYNFIVYDYANDVTVSTTVTSVAFGAMQGVDMYRDKFLVMNGSTFSSMPNGYRWYDKNGKITSWYVIGTMANVEPEGVFIDRETGEILMGFADLKIYRVDLTQ